MDLNKNMDKIAKVTGENIKIISNAMKSILSRIQMKEKQEYLLKKGIDMENMSTQQALDILADKWKTLKDEEKTDIAVNVAGRYQMTRFIILMDNYQK